MTIPYPFSSNFPLSQGVYRSRIQNQIDSAKNYFAVAFKPGFPLQASELNEMQEIFYVQQTLTQELIFNWLKLTQLQQTGSEITGIPWQGCTPLSPDLITYTNNSGTINAQITPGWYLLKHQDFNGGFGVWLYNTNTVLIVDNFNSNSSSNVLGDYGIVVRVQEINCTTSTTSTLPTEDQTLTDSSNINVINGPCGAARLKAEIVAYAQSGVVLQNNEYFLPIFTLEKIANVVKIKFKNNYTITSTA
jgi:hypothetical protein